jgi:hypothetical protein
VFMNMAQSRTGRVDFAITTRVGHVLCSPPKEHFALEERERREENVGGVAIGTTFNGGGGGINLDLRLRRSPGSARSSFW